MATSLSSKINNLSPNEIARVGKHGRAFPPNRSSSHIQVSKAPLNQAAKESILIEAVTKEALKNGINLEITDQMRLSQYLRELLKELEGTHKLNFEDARSKIVPRSAQILEFVKGLKKFIPKDASMRKEMMIEATKIEGAIKRAAIIDANDITRPTAATKLSNHEINRLWKNYISRLRGEVITLTKGGGVPDEDLAQIVDHGIRREIEYFNENVLNRFEKKVLHSRMEDKILKEAVSERAYHILDLPNQSVKSKVPLKPVRTFKKPLTPKNAADVLDGGVNFVINVAKGIKNSIPGIADHAAKAAVGFAKRAPK